MNSPAKKIYIDLSRINPAYAGGVSRFSLGLAAALLETSAGYPVKLIVSAHNAAYLRSIFKDAEIITHTFAPFHRHMLAAISIVCYLMKSPALLLMAEKYSAAPEEIKAADAMVVCPTSTLNFYNSRINSLLCIHDIQHEIHPENFSFLVRAVRWAQYRLSAALSTWVQVSSDAIRQDLINKFGSHIGEKIFMAPEGFDEKLFAADLPAEKPGELPLPPGEPFIYYPAQLWKHKNHNTVIEGLSIFNRTAAQPANLVLTGRDYGQKNNILPLAGEKNVKIIYLGVVPESQMRWLYKNAICAVAAGYHESSSLPIREAIASGGQMLAADIPPNLEISELRGLYLFQTFSPEDFAKQLAFLQEQKNTPAAPSNVRIEDFMWKNIAPIYREHFYTERAAR